MNANPPSLVIVAGGVVLAMLIVVPLLAMRATGFRTALVRMMAGLVGAAMAFPLALLLLDVVFPHLRRPGTWIELFFGVQIVFVGCMGGTLAALWLVTSRERKAVRDRMAPKLDGLRKERLETLQMAARLAEKDPTLAPLIRQMEARNLAFEEFSRSLGLPEADLPVSAKGRPPVIDPAAPDK